MSLDPAGSCLSPVNGLFRSLFLHETYVGDCKIKKKHSNINYNNKEETKM